MKFRLKFIKMQNLSYENEENIYSFYRIFSIFIFTLIISYLLYIPQKDILSSFDIKTGKPVTKDIIFQKNVNVEDKEKTEEIRLEKIKNLTPVYIKKNNEGKTKKLINDIFSLLRKEKKNIYKSKNHAFTVQKTIKQKFGLNLSVLKMSKIINSNFFKKISITDMIDMIDKFEAKGILYSKSGLRENKDGKIKILFDDSKTELREINSFYDLSDIKSKLINFFINQELSSKNAKTIAEIILEFIEINVSYSEQESINDKNKLITKINPVFVKFKKGSFFLSQNDIVTERDIYILNQIKTLNDIDKDSVPDFYLIFIILFSLFLLINQFYKSFEKAQLNSKKLFLVTLSTISLSALISRLSIFLIPIILNSISINFEYDMNSIYYAIPFGFSTLVIAFTFNLHSSVIFSFLNAFISAMLCSWDLHIAIYVLIGNLAVSFGIEYYQRLKRSPVFKAGFLWLLPSNLILISLFNINNPEINISILLINIVLGIFSATMSSLFATFLIPIWESLFKLITDLKLNELNNLNLPVFREMMEKAPGTYHHSQMVASLAEEAATDLGIPRMMLTSMGLYHDIGKIENPNFFTENHSIYPNPHLKISPKESAKMIKNHLAEGMERAKKLKLPEEITDAILQHHGTKIIKFFYDKAKEENSIETDKIQRKDYKYSGVRPQNIENGIIMLADQVEAASKSLSAPTEKEIKNVIRKIIDSNISESQFDECEGMTLKALNSIAHSFYKKLSSIYHTRISYPGFNFKT